MEPAQLDPDSGGAEVGDTYRRVGVWAYRRGRAQLEIVNLTANRDSRSPATSYLSRNRGSAANFELDGMAQFL
jgi:hypothetical protein